MRHGPTLLAAILLLSLALGHPAWGDDKVIDRLVQQLGSAKFNEREAASRPLNQIGKPALGALQKASKDSRDAEIRSRAAKLILSIQDALIRPIDLGPHVNQKLDERFHNYHPGNDLAALPTGKQSFAGIRFMVGRGVVQLGAGKPEKVEGIKVGMKAVRLQFLHACGHQGGTPRNSPIAKYVVHYADRTKAEIEVAYGKDVVDWWVQPGVADPTRGKVAWEGGNKCSRVKLFLATWENPTPEKQIVALDYVTTKSTPFCVAITAEQ